MAGSLKVTCATGARAWAYTAAFGTLNAQSNFTFSCWFEIASLGPEATNCDLAGAVTNYPVTVGIQNVTHLQLYASSAGAAKTITYQPSIDAKGHFIVVSYDATGTTTIYVDGAPAKTIAAIGTTAAADQVVNIGINAAGAAVTVYLKDVAIWGGYSATQQDVIDLRDGTHTPATLATPASNWWTLQGPAGAVTDGTQGLADPTGGVNLATFHDAGGSLAYDSHEITLSHSVLMMPPYCDVTGNLVFIPLYLDPVTTAGGPGTPVSVNVAPVFQLNGSTISPTLLTPLQSGLYAIVYQMPSGTSVAAGDTLTMSAPMGWSSATAGLVSGTSTDGTSATPLTVTNYAGQPTEFPITKTLKVGYNAAPFGNANNAPGQPRANYASRLSKTNGWTGGTVLTFDATTQLPATLSGQGRGVLYFGNNNMVDGAGTPSVSGTWTLVYGDATPGVTSNPSTGHMLTIELGDTVTERTVVSAGTWDGSAWRGITKTYHVDGIPTVLIDSIAAGGAVAFPALADGQFELGVFPPSPADRTVSSPITWDPLAVDPEYLEKLAGANAIRWMPDIGGAGNDGDSTMLTVADLDQRAVNDFLWTKQTPVTCNITKVEPIGATFDTIVDYQGGTQSVSAANWHDSGMRIRVPFLCTTDADHGMRTGDPLGVIATSAAPAPAVKQDTLLLAAAITVTTSPVTFTVSDANPPLAASQVVQIDSEQLTVTGVSGASVTATRGTAGTTPATHLINAPVYTSFLTATISTTSGPTTITVARATGITSIIQIDSEQMEVTAINSPTSLTVNRAVYGTTGATHAIGAIVYPCLAVTSENAVPRPFVTGARTFVMVINCGFLPTAGGAALTNPTIAATVNYTAPDCPVLSTSRPTNIGSVPYEFAAKTTNTVAVANGRKTVLWINVAFLATDDLVTEIVANRVIPYIGLNVDVIVQLSNEIWNGSTGVYQTANVLSVTAPNPETPGTPFANTNEFAASRQNHINVLAKAAFTAAGLDPGRVYDLQAGQHQISAGQGTSEQTIAYCQANGIPIDYFTIDGYVDITTTVWDLFWSWMPTADGGSAAWSRAIARRVMMSYFRAWCWYSQYLGGGILGNAQLLSWYKAGQSVANSGVGTATANTGLGKLCFYESATEFITGGAETAGQTSSAGDFVHPNAMEHDLVYDGIPQWTGDTGWKATEEAYYAAKQSAAAAYAALMPSASFPDLTSATSAITCLYASTYTWGSQGQAWLVYAYQSQQPGDGATNTMTVPSGTGWVGATPVEQGGVNQSIRGQAAIDWIAAAALMHAEGTLSDQEVFDLLAAIGHLIGASAATLTSLGRLDHPTMRARGGGTPVGPSARRWIRPWRGSLKP